MNAAKLDYKNLKAWPFIEALKVFKDIQNKRSKKLFLKKAMAPPEFKHIGTFAEVLRTNMVRNALKTISDFPSRLITFSDDMDALKKNT